MKKPLPKSCQHTEYHTYQRICNTYVAWTILSMLAVDIVERIVVYSQTELGIALAMSVDFAGKLLLVGCCTFVDL